MKSHLYWVNLACAVVDIIAFTITGEQVYALLGALCVLGAYLSVSDSPQH